METIDESILLALNARQDRTFLYSLEDEFKHLVNNAQSDECIVFPTMTSYHRLLIHKVGERYGLYSESNGWGTERQTTVITTPRANLPCLAFRDFIIYEGTPPDRTPKKAKFDITETTPTSTSSSTTPATIPDSSSTPINPTAPTNVNSNPPITSPPTTNTPTPSPPTHASSTAPSNATPPISAPSSATPSATTSLSTTPPTTTPPTTTPPTTTPPTATLPTATPPTATPPTATPPTTTPPTTTPPPATNSSITTPPATTTIPAKKPRRNPKPDTPGPNEPSGPRIKRGRGASKFHAREEEEDSFAVEDEKKEQDRDKEEGEIAGGEEEEGMQGVVKEEEVIGEDEEGLANYKQLPLLNDYSQFEYGNPSSKSKSTNAYGFSSHEHIVEILSQHKASKEEIEKLIMGTTKQRFTLKSKGNVTYSIFRSVEAAKALLEKSSKINNEYQFSLLTLTSTPKKEEFSDEGIYPRPETTARVARRLIGNALEMANLR